MTSALAHWVGTLLTAKLFAGLVRQDWGLAPDAIARSRAGFSVDLPYLWLLAVFSVGIQWVGVPNAVLLAILLRLGVLLSPRILGAANHYFIELFALTLILRSYASLDALAAATQLMVVSVWAYAALQKVYHGQFATGLFFYVGFQDSRPTNRWPAMASWVRRLEGRYAPIDRAGLDLCRRLALVAVLVELLGPVVAIMASGTWWGAAAMLITSVAIAYVSGETSFFITNAVLALLFLVPFEATALSAAIADPMVALILGYCLLWPPLHAVLTKALHVSTWKLGGWGMYATVPPLVSLIDSSGRLVAQNAATRSLGVLELYGRCRVAFVRRFAQRLFLRWYSGPETIRGFVFQRWAIRDDLFVTEADVFPSGTARAPAAFTLADQASVDAFEAHVSTVARSSTGATDVTTMPTLDTPVGAIRAAIPNCVLEEL